MMLETQAPAVTSLPRSTTQRSPRSTASAAAARVAPRPLPRTAPAVPQRKSVQVGSRLERSETRLLTVAVTCTVLVCSLLIIYLGAYARVTLLGLHQSEARVILRQELVENEMLSAQNAALQNPTRINAKAQSLGMVRGSAQVCYIPQHEGM